MVRRAFSSVIDGDTIDGVDIQQVIEAFQGVSTVRVPISITQVDSTTSYALDVRNTNNNNSLAFRVLDSSGTPRLQIASSNNSTLTAQSVKIDPTGGGTLSDITTDLLASTMANKTFSSCTLSTTTKVTLGSDATGDVWYRNSSGEMARLAIGAVGTHLAVSNSSLPSWSSALPSWNPWIPAAAWEFSTGDFPQVAKMIGTNWTVRALRFQSTFSVSTNQSCYINIGIPSGVPVNNITAYIHWWSTLAAGAGVSTNVVLWNIAHAAVASSAALQPAAAGTETSTGIASSLSTATLNITSVPFSTANLSGYATNREMLIKLTRNVIDSSDSWDQDVLFRGMRLEFR